MKALTAVTDSLFGFVITKNHNWEYAGFWFIFPSFVAASRNAIYGIPPWWLRRLTYGMNRPPHYLGRHRRHYRRAWDSISLRNELNERARDNAKVLDSLALKGELTIYGI